MLKIKNKEYELVYDINVMCKMAGAGIDVMDNGIDKIISSLPNLRKAFSYGLMHNNKKITENQAGNLMTAYLKEEGNSIQDLIEEVANALSDGLGTLTNDENIEDSEEGK